jgi:DnaJ-class molecular chaperone
MKRFIAILSLSLLLMAGGLQTTEAQKAKAAKKLIELVSKTAKKAPKKATSVKRTTPLKTVTRPRPRVITVTCSQCNGKGTVTIWNSYYDQYQTIKCVKCNGTGKVHHN